MTVDYWHQWEQNAAAKRQLPAALCAMPPERQRIVAPAAPAPAPEVTQSQRNETEKKSVSAPEIQLERAYDPAVLNTDSSYPLPKIIDGLVRFGTALKEKRNKVRNCCLLFYGPPGTGKTEFGKYLASQAKLDFLVRRGSDLLGEYVGQTENAIRKLFDEAQERHAVAMIDEADTFLRNRAFSHREYEVSMTNELLCRMEEFNGIFICSTNFLRVFDPASMRRFVFKINFRPLNRKGREKLCRRMMAEVCDLPEKMPEIAALDGLTPGNFRTVRDRLLILNESRIGYEELVRELKLELQLAQAVAQLE